MQLPLMPSGKTDSIEKLKKIARELFVLKFPGFDFKIRF